MNSTELHCLLLIVAFVPEAASFDAMLAGARQYAGDDEQLLAAAAAVLDALYAHFFHPPATPATR